MPALISLSPRLADHTFPRDVYELQLACRAIGNLSKPVEERTVYILSNKFFRDLLQGFTWNGNNALKNQIMTHLSLWLLHDHAVKVEADIGSRPYSPHPLPADCRTDQGLAGMWADELGRILVRHDDHTRSGEYFIGIACEKAFAGGAIGQYERHACARHFPLVGPNTCDCTKAGSLLADAFERKVPLGYTQTEVTVAAAKRNCIALGAAEVRRPRRGSHYKVKFPNARSWTLDPNYDPVPEEYLKELQPITGLSLAAIIYTLREGRLPPLQPRIDSSVS